MADFDHGLFGCFDNIGLCFFSWLLPCYTHGKTAELLGEDCMHCGLALIVPCYNIYNLATIRGRVRETKGIPGSFGNDCMLSLCCFACVVIQHAQQMGTVTPLGAGQSMARV